MAKQPDKSFHKGGPKSGHEDGAREGATSNHRDRGQKDRGQKDRGLDAPRRALQTALAEAGLTLKQASRLIGRNDAYLQQYLFRGSPRLLPETVRWQLAELTDTEQSSLAPDDLAKAGMVKNDLAKRVRASGESRPQPIAVPLFDVRAAAGGGAQLSEGAEDQTDSIGFPPALLHRITAAPANRLKLITITGDSMAPTLEDGDLVMIDGASIAPSPPGVFVLDDGVGLVAKRIDAVPNTHPRELMLSSDNPAYATYQRRSDEVHIVGRIIWFARSL